VDLKPVSSATAGSETLADGRKRFWVKHEVLKDVTPVALLLATALLIVIDLMHFCRGG